MVFVDDLAGLAFLALASAVPQGGVDHSRIAASKVEQPAAATCHRQLTTTDTKDVRISGMLVQRRTYGPPNYGENPKTDLRLSYWVLRLDYPVTVLTGVDIGMPSQTVTAREMQIRLGSGLKDLTSFRGKHVIVQGQAATQVFATDMTPVVFDGSSMVVGGPIPCEG
jgi:hypothetical protein